VPEDEIVGDTGMGGEDEDGDGLKACQQKDRMDSLSSAGSSAWANACVKRNASNSASGCVCGKEDQGRPLFQHTRRIRNAFRWNAYVCTQSHTYTITFTHKRTQRKRQTPS